MDRSLFELLFGIAGNAGFVDALIVFFAKHVPYALVLAAGVFVLKQSGAVRRMSVFIFIILTTLLSRGVVTEIIRAAYDRKRPFEVLDISPLFYDFHSAFPSGHAAFFFALAFAILFFSRKAGFWFLGFALLNGAARVVAGVHWPTDILGGIAVALLSYGFVFVLLKPYIIGSDSGEFPSSEVELPSENPSEVQLH